MPAQDLRHVSDVFEALQGLLHVSRAISAGQLSHLGFTRSWRHD